VGKKGEGGGWRPGPVDEKRACVRWEGGREGGREGGTDLADLFAGGAAGAVSS